MVLRVFNSFTRDHPSKMKDEPVKMCADYTGVGMTTVYKILREQKCQGSVREPKKPSGRKTHIMIDDCVKNAIRRKIHAFYFRNELPTLNKTLNAIREDSDTPAMSKETLRKTLHEMNFTYGKVDRESTLIERDEIIKWRRNYIRTIRMYRQQDKKNSI